MKSAVIRDSVLIVLVVLVTVAILMEEPAVYKHILQYCVFFKSLAC